MNEPQDDRLGEPAPARDAEESESGLHVNSETAGEIRDAGSGEPGSVLAETPHFVSAISEIPATEPAMFQSFAEAPPRPVSRIPNFGHLGLLFLLGLVGLVCTFGVLFVVSRLHLLGFNLTASNAQSSAMDARVIVLSEGTLYLATFALSLIVFPLFWNESFFAGVQWRASLAVERFWWLAGTALGCFVLAMIDGALMPGPSNAPIEKVFKTAGSAWMMFAFGITMAPFFEEMLFRGFLLPSLCTAWDWTAEKLIRRPRLPLDGNGHPQWSMAAMVFGAILTSLPFAGIHAEQQGNSLGPFLLLIVVSLILCAARLKTRSLAASTIVHACYNFCIFSATFVQTSGFRHMDKM